MKKIKELLLITIAMLIFPIIYFIEKFRGNEPFINYNYATLFIIGLLSGLFVILFTYVIEYIIKIFNLD